MKGKRVHLVIERFNFEWPDKNSFCTPSPLCFDFYWLKPVTFCGSLRLTFCMDTFFSRCICKIAFLLMNLLSILI